MNNQKQLPHHKQEFRGYTMDELRYHRAYAAARVEINRQRLEERLHNFSNGGMKSMAPTNFFGKILGAFSYIDLGVMAWKIGSQAFKVVRRLKR